ncbi:tripartite tricarboxylate transporter substrate binding protein [Aquabacter spiritensis]|uniref:Tripartite-type tricarboxylate transporter receptor subunit TctC n=1 Tax=Aquabacter spiritensis TaxID=933073 RepID=A0A4V2UY67_9HYPH|nr:tripartite tricarboxylate transporter substrate binding protein [Aquabacter spiritensis]TCT06228.1 tripartite-type tricarboxylate transporter receptor subunit TctC [Aquabacter spiritensis]
MRLTHLAGGLALAMLLLPASAGAQTAYPNKAIDLIVPFAPGGSTGLTARAVGQALEELWKVPVRVVSKPGGNTVPAVEEVMRSKPDGYTMLADSPASSSMLEVVVKNPPNPVMDRSFAGMVAQTPMIFVVPADSPFKTMQDAIARLKSDPGTFTWTSLGGAGAQDYTFRQLFKAADVDIKRTRPVASKGGSEAVTMTAGGHVMLGAGSWSAVSPLLQSGKLRVLAVASDGRFPPLPDTPTMAEVGYPAVQILFWFAVSGPPNLPQDVVAAWNKGLATISKDPKFQSQLANIGMVPYFHDAAKVRTFVADEKKTVEALWAVGP